MHTNPSSTGRLLLALLIGLALLGPRMAWGQCAQAKLTASNGGAFDHLGWSVAIDGDVAVVGAPDDFGATGAAYVYRFISGEWVEEAILTASDGTFNDFFGQSVAISGDVVVVTSFAVVVPGFAGVAYVFEKPPGGWGTMTETAQLASSQGFLPICGQLGCLAIPVAASGDVIVVGAPGQSGGGFIQVGAAYVFERPPGGWGSVGSPIGETAQLLASDGAATDWFGNSVAIDGVWIVIGAMNEGNDPNDVENDGWGAAYLFEAPPGGPITETLKLQDSEYVPDGGGAVRFGRDVSISGSLIAIGSDKDAILTGGTVFVFEEPAGGWASEASPLTETDSFTTSDHCQLQCGTTPFNNGLIGSSVAVWGDMVLAGAPGDDIITISGNAGAVYVFQKQRGDLGWPETETDKLYAPDAETLDGFGFDVAASGGLAVVGAYNEGNSGNVNLPNGPGAAYVFLLDETLNVSPSIDQGDATMTLPPNTSCPGEHQLALTAGDPDGNDAFLVWSIATLPSTGLVTFPMGDSGPSVEICYEPDPDQCATDSFVLRVEDDCGGFDEIVVDVTVEGVGPWALEDEVFSGQPQLLSLYGWSVSVSGDVAIVGAYLEDMGGLINPGAAYVYELNPVTEAWDLKTKLVASQPVFGEALGRSVSISGDVAVIGTQNEVAYVFQKPPGGWDAGGSPLTETAVLEAADPAALPFGRAVAIDGDVAVVGAQGTSVGASQAGAVYVFERPAGGWASVSPINETARLLSSNPSNGDSLGSAVAIDGDVVVAGALAADSDAALASGAAFVFEKPPGGWTDVTETARLEPSDGGLGDQFGRFAASISGEMVLIGSRNHRFSVGAAYVFERPPAGWTDMTETQKLANPDQGVDLFGHAVTISGPLAIVGAYLDDTDSQDQGSAYVYRRDPVTGIWSQELRLIAGDDEGSDGFGIAVALDGDLAVIGTTGDDDAGLNAGSAYMFRSPADCNGNAQLDTCDIAAGTSLDDNNNGIPDECEIPGDIDGDGSVGVSDLLILLGAWGSCPDPCPPSCPADLDGDCQVAVTDLLILLANWG